MRDGSKKRFCTFLAILLFLPVSIGLTAYDTAKAASSDLFFSEYVEGSSNNKALEIFNGTGGTVNLASNEYSVKMFFNGSATAGLTINLTGTVAAGDVFVLAHASANPAILAVADQTSSAGWFNGDDAVVLMRGTTVIDCIGRVGEDPGTAWSIGGVSTLDRTLVRKPLVAQGDSVSDDVFDPSLQWLSYPTDSFAFLGSHDISTFLVTFDLGSHGTLGSGQLSQYVFYGQSASAPVVIPDVAHYFTGWDTAFDNVTSNLVVTAQYEIKTYTVAFSSGAHGSFDPAGAPSNQIVNYGGSAAAPLVIPDVAYDFTGWDIVFDNVTSNLNITAQYSIKSFTVTFNPGTHGSFDPAGAPNIQTINYGGSATPPTVNPDLFYNAVAWDMAFGNITCDLTVTALYSVKTSPGLFFSEYVEGSSNNKSLEIFNGTRGTLNLASNEYSVKMFFNGSATAGLTINLTGTVAAGDVYVLAHASANPAILAVADQTSAAGWFNGDDAVVLMRGTTVIDCIGRVGEDPGTAWEGGGISTLDRTLVRKPRIAQGDAIQSDVFDPSLQWLSYPTDSFAFLGSHDISTFLVTFDLGSHGTLGSGQLSQNVYYAYSASAPVVIPDVGYNFTGWDTAFDIVTSNLVVTAQYEIKTFTLTYTPGAHGYILGDTPQVVTTGGSGTAVTAVADDHYRFVRWSDGVLTAVRTDRNVTGSISVSAEFEVIKYRVAFVDYDGTVLKTQNVAFGGTASPPEDPIRTGYTFTGWDGDYFDIKAGTTITARYSINKYEVIFIDFDGSVLDTQVVEYGKDAKAPEDPHRANYVFSGWDKPLTFVKADMVVTAQYSPEAPHWADVDENVAKAGWQGGREVPFLLFLLVAVAAIIAIAIIAAVRRKHNGGI